LIGLALLIVAFACPAQSNLILAWNALTNSPIAGYRVYQGPASRSYTISTNVGKTIQTTIPGLTAGVTYYYAVTGYTATGLETDYSAETSYTVPLTTNPPVPIPPVTTLPLPWLSGDIGIVAVAGSAGFSNSTFTVNGAGSFNSTADSFRFVYQTLSDDGQISAQINSLDSHGAPATAGVMIRESLTTDSRYVLMGASNGKLRRQRRTATGGSTTASSWGNARLPNLWVRLVRSGGTISSYQSSNGTTWSLVDSFDVGMASNIYLGLAVASNGSATPATAILSHVNAVP
jgi:hypothetical protein